MGGVVGVGVAPQGGGARLESAQVDSATKKSATESTEHDHSHKKEKSVLQAKLTKLAIQIGYAGECILLPNTNNFLFLKNKLYY